MKHRYQSAVLPARLDLTSEQDVVQFCTTFENIKIDVAIYCAGHNPVCLCDELEPENISTTTRLNYLSAVLIFNTIVKTMKQYKENETKLVFISSVAAKKISVGNSLYGSTKAAMERYLSSIALEMARFNIRTLCLSPGYIKTKMLQDYCAKEGRSIASIEKTIPMRKMLATEDYFAGWSTLLLNYPTSFCYLSLALVSLISLLVKKPFTIFYASSGISEEKRRHRMFYLINKCITWIWVVIFFANGLLNAFFAWTPQLRLATIGLVCVGILFSKYLPNIMRYFYRVKHHGA